MTSSSVITVRLEPDVRERFKSLCERENRTMSETLRSHISRVVEAAPETTQSRHRKVVVRADLGKFFAAQNIPPGVD